MLRLGSPESHSREGSQSLAMVLDLHMEGPWPVAKATVQGSLDSLGGHQPGFCPLIQFTLTLLLSPVLYL